MSEQNEQSSVKKLTVWEASDGRRFDNEAEAKRYNGFLIEAHLILLRMGEAPKQGTFIRHLHSRLVEVSHDLRACLAEETGKQAYADAIDLQIEWNGWLNPAYGYLGRILADYDGPFRSVIYRLQCISCDLVEGDQQYWAMHPEARIQKEMPAPVNAFYITPDKCKTGKELGF